MTDSAIVFALVFAVAAAWTAVIIIRIRGRRRHRARLATWAASQEWAFREHGGGDWQRSLPRGDDRGCGSS
jgi:hypothetical protein